MTDELKAVVVPRDLYYHEVAYVRKLEATIKSVDELVANAIATARAQSEQRIRDELEELRKQPSAQPYQGSFRDGAVAALEWALAEPKPTKETTDDPT